LSPILKHALEPRDRGGSGGPSGRCFGLGLGEEFEGPVLTAPFLDPTPVEGSALDLHHGDSIGEVLCSFSLSRPAELLDYDILRCRKPDRGTREYLNPPTSRETGLIVSVVTEVKKFDLEEAARDPKAFPTSGGYQFKSTLGFPMEACRK
jgi:hypothetical protein